MNNTTLQANIVSELADSYDYIGAIIFIVVVLLWYSSSIIFLLGMQQTASIEIVEDSIRHQRLFTNSVCEKTNNKQILEELGDKEKRGKLWDIYLGTSNRNDRITRADTLRIRNIQRQLGTVDEHFRNNNDESSFALNAGSSVPDISLVETPVRARRESTMDQEILEEWKANIDGLKVSENWPWAIQRLLIQRHLRQQRKTKNDRPRKKSIP